MDDSEEVEFRDGKRWIPGYLADMMRGIKTHTLTYDQAVEAANGKQMSDFLNTAQDRTVKAHLARGGRG